MAFGLTPKTFDGIELPAIPGPDRDYHFQFVEDAGTLDSASAQAVTTTRPGLTPIRSYVQPQGMTYVMEVVIDTIDQDTLDYLKGLFDTIGGEDHVLVCTDKNNVDRQIACTIQKWAVRPSLGYIVFAVTLEAPAAVWESTSIADVGTDGVFTLEAPDATWSMDNDGNTAAGLVLTISPTAAIDSEDGYSKARRIHIANRSDQALTHFAAEAYAIEITGGGIDTTSGFAGDLSDLRVFQNGQEIPRWLNDDSPDEATKVWCNLAMQPMRSTVLGSSIAEDDTTIRGDFTFWPRKGWLFIDDEACPYALVDDQTATIQRPDGVSHSADDTVLWIEHVIYLVYGFDNADTPDPALDSKPVIDLDASSNVEHSRPGPFFNNDDLRSMTGRRIIDGEGSPHIRGWDDGDNLVTEDELPVAGKPLADTVEFRFPVPASGTISLVHTVGDGLALQGFVADFQGNESKLIEELTSAEATEDYALDNDATRLRLKTLKTAILGEWGPDTSAFPLVPSPLYAGPGFLSGSSELYTHRYAALHFVFDQDTDVTAFIAKFDTMESAISYSLTNEERTALIKASAFVIAGAGEWSYSSINATLPAGGYWMIFNFTSTTGDILTVARSRASIYVTDVILPGDYAYEDTALTTIHFDDDGNAVYASDVPFPGYVGFGTFDQDPANYTPLFAVLSSKQSPQHDAPLRTGEAVNIDDITVPLDSDKAPKIIVSEELDVFPLIGMVQNSTTGQQVALSIIVEAGEAIELDFEQGAYTDLQFGLPCDYAVQCGDPTRRLQVAKGTNSFAISIPGVSATASLEVVPEYRHTWL